LLKVALIEGGHPYEFSTRHVERSLDFYTPEAHLAEELCVCECRVIPENGIPVSGVCTEGGVFE
jgi:hypothetical protein